MKTLETVTVVFRQRATRYALLAATAMITLPAAVQAQSMGARAVAPKTIVDVAVENGNFKTLVAALQAAGLVETLQGDGPFTVFAPSDAAFAKLPAGMVDGLLADREKLAEVLTFHVVAGRVMAGDIVKANGAKPATVNGQPLNVMVRDGKVYVNGAQVVTADIVTSNGVIHVIDSVLLPTAPGAAGNR